MKLQVLWNKNTVLTLAKISFVILLMMLLIGIAGYLAGEMLNSHSDTLDNLSEKYEKFTGEELPPAISKMEKLNDEYPR